MTCDYTMTASTKGWNFSIPVKAATVKTSSVLSPTSPVRTVSQARRCIGRKRCRFRFCHRWSAGSRRHCRSPTHSASAHGHLRFCLAFRADGHADFAHAATQVVALKGVFHQFLLKDSKVANQRLVFLRQTASLPFKFFKGGNTHLHTASSVSSSRSNSSMDFSLISPRRARSTSSKARVSVSFT